MIVVRRVVLPQHVITQLVRVEGEGPVYSGTHNNDYRRDWLELFVYPMQWRGPRTLQYVMCCIIALLPGGCLQCCAVLCSDTRSLFTGSAAV